jgi:glycosyltransferase involved in cell wall biosynthesis
MRIIHTDTDDIENPLRGGQPVRTFEINSRLAVRHDITVFTATYNNSRDVVRNGIAYKRLGVTIPKWGLSSHLSFLNRLPNTIKHTPHDLILEEFTPPFGFCNLQKFTSKPVVSMVQWHFFKDWEKRYHLPFESIMRKRAQLFQHRNIIVQTHKMGEYFQTLLPNSTVYKIPCGINLSEMQCETPVGEYALFLGRLDIQHKGLDDLLMAWKMLRESGVSIPLWIVGAGKDEETLRGIVKKYDLSSEVVFKGRLEGDEKKTALANCRFLVMPSRQETFGLTALEAMASCKPVIAYDIDHLNELLKPEWSTLVAMGHISKLAESVSYYWNQVTICQQQGLNGYNEAKKYLWDTLALQQEEIYKSLIKTKDY